MFFRAIAVALLSMGGEQLCILPSHAFNSSVIEKLRDTGQFSSMLSAVDYALGKETPNTLLINYRVQALVGLKRWQCILDTLSKYSYLCQTNADKAHFAYMTAGAYREMLKYAETEREVLKSLKLYAGDRQEKLLRLGEAQLRQLKKKEAMASFLSTDNKAMNPGQLNIKALFLSILGNNDQALATIDACLARATKKPWPFKDTKTSILIRMNDKAHACTLLLDSIHHSPNANERKFSSQRLNILNDVAGNTIRFCARLDTMDPLFSEVLELVKKAEYAQLDDKSEKALAYYTQIISMQPYSANAICKRAKAYIEEGRMKEARADAELAAQREPDAPVSYEVMGRLDLDVKKVDEGIKNWRTVLRLAPSSDNFQEMARICEQFKRYDEALKLANQGLALSPNKLKLHLIKGQSLLQKGKAAEAIAEFNAVEASHDISKEPLSLHQAWSGRAAACRLLGRTAMADADEKRLKGDQRELYENTPFFQRADTAGGISGKQTVGRKK